MKKLVVSMFLMVTASFFFVCGVSAASQVQFSISSGDTTVIALDITVSATASGNNAGKTCFFNYSVYETPVSHSGLIQTVSVQYVGASTPSIETTATSTGCYGRFTADVIGNYSLYLNVLVSLRNNSGKQINGYLNINAPHGMQVVDNVIPTIWDVNETVNSIDDKVDEILSLLGGSSFDLPVDFLGNDGIFYFDRRYFRNAWTGVSEKSNDNGFFVLTQNSNNLRLGLDGGLDDHYSKIISLGPGTYSFTYSGYFVSAPTSVSVFGVSLDDINITQDWSVSNHYYIFGYFTLESSYVGRDFVIDFGVNVSPGLIYGGVGSAPDDYLAGSAINPDQSGLVEDVDNAGQQQQHQEDQLWTNINSYKGDLTFNIDDWSEAAGGLSYVSGIFMQIWNNSPTQIIILSLMLGIAMLSIGRGVQAAVRVSRHRDDG